MADITMPQLGETVTEGTITKWLKNVGDRIEEDEVIYEVSTDKVDSEVPSPVSGFLTEIKVPEGETAEVGAVLAVVADAPPSGGGGDAGAEDDVDGTGAVAGGTEIAGERPAADGAPDGGAGGDPEPAAGSDVPSAPPAPPAPAPLAPAPLDDADAPAANGDGSGNERGRVLSPVVRRLIAEHDLDVASLAGTGAGGRITRADVLAVIDDGAATSAAARTDDAPVPGAPASASPLPTPTPAPAAAAVKPAPAAAAVKPGERDEVVPFSNIRRRTAEHMVRSLGTSAHTLVVIEVDYENVDKVRTAAKEQFRTEEGTSLTYLPFIARALVDAIREFPHVNASVGNDELIVHRYVNLGIAVDMDYQGLIVPVVHDAETKRLRALAREIADLGRRAKAKKLGADEIAGGTFTITNAGGYGTLITGPIINQPQVAILSTDGVKPRPVAIALPGGGYGLAVHPVGNLAISFDHRAYDGAYASAFLARLKEILETRDWTSELS
ncbi:MAG TPA: dihydrolipoamide acetyltransferase family protein [Acidimicrobiales bacterium]|nr:dihydrolipoamide acetyltransferase family protein [Acidimicrobiales bacterium]